MYRSTAETSPGRKAIRRPSRRLGSIVLFVLPALVVYTVLLVYPIVDALRLSLFTGNRGSLSFAGADNYIRLFTDPYLAPIFWGALSNNALYLLITLVVQLPLALALAALIVSVGRRWQDFYRTIIFLPAILSIVLVGFVWRTILSPLWGAAESLLDFVGLGALFAPYLGQTDTALTTLALIASWQGVGIPTMIFSAALLSISEEVLEAGQLDRAGPLRLFFSVKLPLILPTIGIVAVLQVIAAFNAFDIVYTLQGSAGNPNYSTDVLGTLFYRTFYGAIGGSGSAGGGDATMGAAIASVTFLTILALVSVYFFVLRNRLDRTR